jgi:hypothetical protein
MTDRKCFAWAAVLALALPVAGSAQGAPGVFQIPGTESTIKFYGNARLDVSYDLNRAQTGMGGATNIGQTLPTTTGGNPQFALVGIPWTRFGLTTSTPSSLGNVSTRIEADFAKGTFGSVYSSQFRVRQAYGTLSNFLLIGQTWSTFTDIASNPDTVDFNGLMNFYTDRAPQIRVTLPVASGLSLALAAELQNASPLNNGNFLVDLAGKNVQVNQLPDFVAALKYSTDWGYVSVRGDLFNINTVDNSFGKALSVFGVVGAATTVIDLGGDTLMLGLLAGKGAGMFIDSLMASAVIADNGDGTYTLPLAGAGYLAFTHVFSPSVRVNLIASGAILQNDKDVRAYWTDAFYAIQTQRNLQFFGNVFYTVAKNMEVGFEYTWGQRYLFNGDNGVLSRVTANAVFNLF